MNAALAESTQAVAMVTFSIGAIAFLDTPASVNTALQQADELMYRAKAAGKGRILCACHPPRNGEI